MPTEKQFWLSRPTLAIEFANGKEHRFLIPAKAIVNVLTSTDKQGGTVDVVWEGSVAKVFLVDLQAAGIEITHSLSAGA